MNEDYFVNIYFALIIKVVINEEVDGTHYTEHACNTPRSLRMKFFDTLCM